MPRNVQTSGNLALAGYDDIFKPTIAAIPYISGGQIIEMPLEELYPPEFNPFQVNDDAVMTRLVRSITKYGLWEPGLVRPRADGGYELISGNRRKRACEIVCKPTMPVIIREMDDDSAAIAMVDINLEQRKLLHSEKAWAYRVKLEALDHNGVKGDMLSVEALAEQTGESKTQIFRIIRMTWLVLDLLDKVDTKQLAFNPAVELSYLSHKEQAAVASTMDLYSIKPSLSQAVRLKKMKQAGTLTTEKIDRMLSEDKKPPKNEPTGSMRFRKYFPPDYSQKQMEAIIIELLTKWKAGAAV
jgi:ParB family chromosome partitioning protein